MKKQTPNYSCEVAIRWSDFDTSGEITDTTFIELAREARMGFERHLAPPRPHRTPHGGSPSAGRLPKAAHSRDG